MVVVRHGLGKIGEGSLDRIPSPLPCRGVGKRCFVLRVVKMVGFVFEYHVMPCRYFQYPRVMGRQAGRRAWITALGKGAVNKNAYLHIRRITIAIYWIWHSRGRKGCGSH